MAGLTEFYCPSNETSHGSQFKWLEYTFKPLKYVFYYLKGRGPLKKSKKFAEM